MTVSEQMAHLPPKTYRLNLIVAIIFFSSDYAAMRGLDEAVFACAST